jgi:hypothetical protein
MACLATPVITSTPIDRKIYGGGYLSTFLTVFS